MTNLAFSDSVAIDTNIFLHLLNPERNIGSHINTLLAHLQGQGIALLVDERRRIEGEYKTRISFNMSKSDDTGDKIYILRWLSQCKRLRVPVRTTDELMSAIEKVIPEGSTNARVDRVFVYVSFKAGRVLITNDDVHIVQGPEREGNLAPRRIRLMRETRRRRSKGADIVTSQEAHAKISHSCPQVAGADRLFD